MLIYVIPSSFPTDINPQASIFVYEQCEKMTSLGHKVVVLDAMTYSWRYWGDKTCSSIHHTNKKGMNIYSLHVRGAAKRRLPLLSVIQFQLKIQKLYRYAERRHGKPDVLYAHFTHPSGYIACKLGKKIGIPVVVQEHYGTYFNKKIHPYMKYILRKTILDATAFFCVSNAHKLVIEKWSNTKNKVKVVPNMISDIFQYYDKTHSGNYHFFSAGNLVPVKRFDLLIKAFIKTFKSDEKVQLKIAGYGVEWEMLSRIIEYNNRNHQIVLMGRLNRDEMLNAYINSDCFVLVSEHESFGIVYREAMAVGKPVIATKNGGIEEGWKDSYGILIPVNSEDELAKAMENMFENRNISLYDDKQISTETIKNYGSDKIIETIIKKLETAVDLYKQSDYRG